MAKLEAKLVAAPAAVVLSVLVVAAVGHPAMGSNADKDDDRKQIREIHVHEIESGERPFLGVQVTEDVTDDEGGARIEFVVPDSPADIAGIEEDDVIVELGGRTVRGPRALTEALGSNEPGDTVKIDVVRDGDRKTVTVKLGAHPHRFGYAYRTGQDGARAFAWSGDDLRELSEGMHEHHARFQRPLLGVELVAATPELREHLGGDRARGVLVGRVIPDSAAEVGGIRVGDLIESVDGADIEDVGDLIGSVFEHAGESVSIGLTRDGRAMEIRVDLPDHRPARGAGSRSGAS